MKLGIWNCGNKKLRVEILDALDGLDENGEYFKESGALKKDYYWDIKRRGKDWKKLKAIHLEVCRNNTLRIYLWRYRNGLVLIRKAKMRS